MKHQKAIYQRAGLKLNWPNPVAITPADWEAQLACQARLAATGAAAAQHRLRVLESLTKEVWPAGRAQIPLTELSKIIDRALIKKNLSLTTKLKEYDRDRRYTPAGTLSCYDIIFYNSRARHQSCHYRHIAHMRAPELRSVCFCRAEEVPQGDTILFGNFQIDNRQAAWTPTGAQIYGNNKSLNLNMLQEAVATALAKGKTKIYFQAGIMSDTAQGHGNTVIKHKLITEKNYAQEYARYQKRLALFEKYQPGGKDSRHYWIAEKTKEYYVRAHNFLTAINAYRRISTGFAGCHHEFAQGLMKGLGNKTLLRKLNQYFKSDGLKFNTPPAAAQSRALEQLKEYYQNLPDKFDLHYKRERLEIKIEEFYINYNYITALAQRFPAVRRLQCAGESAGEPLVPGRTNFYIAKEPEFTTVICKPSRPRIGRYHNDHVQFGNRNLWDWHQERLPKLLGELGLQVSYEEINQKLQPDKRGDGAWLVTAGLEDFSQKPLARFSQDDRVRGDTETMTNLTNAVKKFGLAPAALKIINQDLATNWYGRYHNGKITLKEKSLALLSHEGIHHLIESRQLPVKEITALATLGKKIVKKDVDYPGAPGPCAGNLLLEEYAAIAAEKYVHTDKILRKQLMNQKLTVLEKITRYARWVKNHVGKALGFPAALALCALQRIATNEASKPRRAQEKNISARPRVILPGY